MKCVLKEGCQEGGQCKIYDECYYDRPTEPKPSLWIPITDAVDLAHLGKLAEELGECSAIVGRCIIQGADGAEPTTGKINRVALEEEIVDVFAAAQLVAKRFGLSWPRTAQRIERKKRMKREWHRMLKDAGH
jgi:hypothetical protein